MSDWTRFAITTKYLQSYEYIHICIYIYVYVYLKVRLLAVVEVPHWMINVLKSQSNNNIH